MKFNFQIFIRSLLRDVIFFIISAIAATVIGRTVLLTIAYAIFGEDNGVAAATVMMRIAAFIFTFALIEIFNYKNDSEKRTYLSIMQDKKYSFRDDYKEIVKSEYFLSECIPVIIITVAFSLLISTLYLLPFIIIFCFLHIFIYTLIHKRWATSRIRFK